MDLRLHASKPILLPKGIILYTYRDRSSLISKSGALESHLLVQSAQHEQEPMHKNGWVLLGLWSKSSDFGVKHQAPAVWLALFLITPGKTKWVKFCSESPWFLLEFLVHSYSQVSRDPCFPVRVPWVCCWGWLGHFHFNFILVAVWPGLAVLHSSSLVLYPVKNDRITWLSCLMDRAPGWTRHSK